MYRPIECSARKFRVGVGSRRASLQIAIMWLPNTGWTVASILLFLVVGDLPPRGARAATEKAEDLVSNSEIVQAVIIRPLFTIPVEILRIFQQFVAVVHF